ncbi:MAG: hypothetical protein AAGF32_05755 [Pseudomonadota bacterium]
MWKSVCAAAVLAASILTVVPLALGEAGDSTRKLVAAEANSLVVRGRRLHCGGGTGKDVKDLPVMGVAIPSRKLFLINTRLMRKFPRSFSHFVFLHECAHMYITSESAADCWAVKRGLYRGIFNRRSVDTICKALWNTPAGLYHNAGPGRCAQLKQCYAKAVADRKRRR